MASHLVITQGRGQITWGLSITDPVLITQGPLKNNTDSILFITEPALIFAGSFNNCNVTNVVDTEGIKKSHEP